MRSIAEAEGNALQVLEQTSSCGEAFPLFTLHNGLGIQQLLFASIDKNAAFTVLKITAF